MLKKELVNTEFYSKELGINILINEKNIGVLKSIKADVFEYDKPKETIGKRSSTNASRENND